MGNVSKCCGMGLGILDALHSTRIKRVRKSILHRLFFDDIKYLLNINEYFLLGVTVIGMKCFDNKLSFINLPQDDFSKYNENESNRKLTRY